MTNNKTNHPISSNSHPSENRASTASSKYGKYEGIMNYSQLKAYSEKQLSSIPITMFLWSGQHGGQSAILITQLITDQVTDITVVGDCAASPQKHRHRLGVERQISGTRNYL